MKKILVGMLVVGVLAATGLFAAGTSGAVVLSFPVGARAIGMAEAFTAVTGDVAGLHYNPANIANLQDKMGSVFYRRGIADDNFGVIDVGMPIANGALAGTIKYYGLGELQLITDLGEERTVNGETDIVVQGTFARFTPSGFGFGVSAFFLNSSLVGEFSGTAFGGSLGVLYVKDALSIGASVLNLGTALKYRADGEADSLPMTIRAGGAYKMDKLTVAADIVKPNDGSVKEHIGLEYLLGDMIAVRGGYKVGYDLDGLTAGFGVKLDNITVDYALGMMSELGSMTHQVSVAMKFK